MTPVDMALQASGMSPALSSSSLAGGSICDVRCVHLEDGSQVVCKIVQEISDVNMLASECRGLEQLSATNCIRTPTVLAHVTMETSAVLILEYLERGENASWQRAGRSLAALHQSACDVHYGSGDEVWLGRTRFPPISTDDWGELLIENRLRPLLRDVVDARTLDRDTAHGVEERLAVIRQAVPSQPAAALLHGDLWAGNLMPLATGDVAFLDPASFIGDPIADPAMTLLFGGIPQSFMGSWCEVMGEMDNVQERIAGVQAMHLLNHVRLFGSGYVPQLMDCLKTFA